MSKRGTFSLGPRTVQCTLTPWYERITPKRLNRTPRVFTYGVNGFTTTQWSEREQKPEPLTSQGVDHKHTVHGMVCYFSDSREQDSGIFDGMSKAMQWRLELCRRHRSSKPMHGVSRFQATHFQARSCGGFSRGATTTISRCSHGHVRSLVD